MEPSSSLLTGEFRRALDDRYRVSIPAELLEPVGEAERWVLAKERPGALSLWPAARWKGKTETGVELVQAKFASGRLDHRLTELQRLGRLLSTRHTEVQLGGRGRLLIPEGFREFLEVEAGRDVLIIGAAVCIEIWRPAAWVEYLRDQIPQFNTVLEELAH